MSLTFGHWVSLKEGWECSQFWQMGRVCGSIPQVTVSADVAVSSQIRLSGLSGLSNAIKGVEMNAHTSRRPDKTKAIRSSVHRQFAILLAAAASFAFVIGQGGLSAKAGSCLGIR